MPPIQSSEAVQQTPNVRHHLWSTTKTLTSAMIGIAIASGMLLFFYTDPNSAILCLSKQSAASGCHCGRATSHGSVSTYVLAACR